MRQTNNISKVIEKTIDLLGIKSFWLDEITKFVPYVYLDGHRTGNPNKSNIEAYTSGIEFYSRFVAIAHTLGIKDVVVMVHTRRNSSNPNRIKSVYKAIHDYPYKSQLGNIYTYGNTNDSYVSPDLKKRIDEITSVNEKPNVKLNSHILLNYSEEWAINNLDEIKFIPNISTIIRFTKGYYCGGYIPLRMEKSTFVYCQNASVSSFWADDSISNLILVAFANWFKMRSMIGNKIYTDSEKKTIFHQREYNLQIREQKCDMAEKPQKRLMTFDEIGAKAYLI